MTTRTTRELAFSDPEKDRERRHIAACEAVERALQGTSYAAVAVLLGLSETDVKRMVKPSEGRYFAVVDLPALPRECAEKLSAWALEPHGLAVVELPKAERGACDYKLVADAQRESAEVISCALEALAAGHVGRTKGVDLEVECDQAIAKLLAVRELARMAKREGVIGLVRSA